MKINVKQLSLIYVDRQKIKIFAPGFKEVEELDLSQDSMRDLEIINRSALQRQLDNWFEQLGHYPTYALVVFSPAVFYIHQFSKQLESDEDEELVAFLQTVPFDAIEHKTYPVGTGAIGVALSKYLYEPLMDVLDDLQIQTIAYIPSAVTGVDFSKQQLSVELAASILANHEQLTDFSFLDPELIEAKLNPKSEFMTVKLDKKLIAMIVFFLVLLLILGALLWSQRQPADEQDRNVVLPPVEYQPEPAVEPEENELEASSEASPAAGIAELGLKITVVPGFLDDEQLDSVVGFLEEGFEVEVDQASTQQSVRTLVMYSSETETAVKREINQLIEDIDPDYSTQTNQSLAADEILIIFRSE